MVVLGLGLLYLFLCYVIGSIAKGQGRSFGLWFILSVIMSPVIPFIGLSLLSKGKGKSYI